MAFTAVEMFSVLILSEVGKVRKKMSVTDNVGMMIEA